MRYEIIAIGNLKRSFLKDGCAFYINRLSSQSKVIITELKGNKSNDPEKTKSTESNDLFSKAKGYSIALDEKGKSFSSNNLAKHIDTLELRGISHISLLIGGANGHSNALKQQVNELWRLSDLTLPHELARLVLLEQLYRVESIRSGHPYHKD